MKKTLSTILGFATVFASFAFTFVLPVEATTHTWDTTGDYVVTMEYQGSDSDHDMTLTQDGVGNLSGDGGSPAGANTYLWTITDGSVVGNTIAFTADYTATPDAVTPQTTLVVTGDIANDGTMSGAWSDNYQGAERSGTWSTASGVATEATTSSLAAEDFGVVSFGTSNGTLSGYSAGFGLTDSTLENAQSVIVELFSGTQLLQTNTAVIAAFNADITGTQFSSPFDVSGAFDYAADGYWVNDRASEYGQNEPATTVVATVVLANGDIVTATNENLSGDPETIFSTDTSPTVTVTIEKFVQGSMATASTASSTDFPMTATWDAENIGAGTSPYTLSEMNDIPYQAMTAEMTKGADYQTKEVVSGDIVSAQCTTGTPFALAGYTTGDTRTEAINAEPSMAMPAFVDLQTDKHVIVWNLDCTAEDGELNGDVVGEDGELEVTSIEMIDTTATANGSFADGWEYVFHVTLPSSEPNVAMKFSDWMETDGTGTIFVDNNMRISSLQADNGGATILLTADNVYSTPDLHMTTDLDPVMDGVQVEITVEVAVPTGTPNGAYTTTYGVQSN